jgi:uncharacterized protein (DUF3084 family)
VEAEKEIQKLTQERDRLRVEKDELTQDLKNALKEGVHRGAQVRKLINELARIAGDEAARKFAEYIKVARHVTDEELNAPTQQLQSPDRGAK